MSEPLQVVVVELTPPGRGAVATLLVEGPGAIEAVDAEFHAASGKPLGQLASNRMVFGHFGAPPGEEVVVHARSSNSVEVHCHGGHAAVEMVRSQLAARGCQVLSWTTWAHQHAEDPIQAAARVALAEARTERTAAILLDQYFGALRHAIEAGCAAVAKQDPQAQSQVGELLDRADLGRHLTSPWRVALAGPPNAGKSSLLNTLVGYRRAIVDPSPGTTRDVLSANTAVEGWPLEISDTAGLGKGQHAIEQAGIELAQAMLVQADLIVLVFDRSLPWSLHHSALVESWPRALIVHNKSDLAESIDPVRPPGIATSAKTGAGIDHLLDAICSRLVPAPPPPGAAVPFADEHVERLDEARNALTRGDASEALAALEGMIRPIAS